MADPLGLIGGANRPGMAPGVMPLQPKAPAGGPPAPGSPTFVDTLMGKIDEVNKLQQEAGAAAEDFAAGRRTDVEGVLMTTEKADAAFRMLVQLRNKLQAAVDETKQVRI